MLDSVSSLPAIGPKTKFASRTPYNVVIRAVPIPPKRSVIVSDNSFPSNSNPFIITIKPITVPIIPNEGAYFSPFLKKSAPFL